VLYSRGVFARTPLRNTNMTEQPKPENLSDGVKSEQEAYLRAVEATMSEFFAQQRTLLTAISHDALPLLEQKYGHYRFDDLPLHMDTAPIQMEYHELLIQQDL